MRLLIWLSIGAVVGLACGLPFGRDYALMGLGLGIAGGFGVFLGLRR
ncbi:hypothetical protein FQ775_23710 [Nitratireductor mangrovi]|uniref:Uncharacterized protein n=1 Tax=Nitratireductor mangrovi TaxID=2599600 RepID=A0A6H0DYE2_9HYPH|nr:hypothetical protein [Nitratireductor mangrovi]QIS94615.1 hypothetical protein FQ775_23710 [Nitratireductor mangrovi]